jgi:hypothetical protein
MYDKSCYVQVAGFIRAIENSRGMNKSAQTMHRSLENCENK